MELSPVVVEPGKALAARVMTSLPSRLGALFLVVRFVEWLVFLLAIKERPIHE